MTNEDPEGKKRFSRFLIEKGFYNIQTTTQFCRWDLEAEKNGVTYYFELKNRSVPSTQYKDIIIQEDKYLALRDIPNCYVVNIYTDNIMGVVPIGAPHTTESHFCQMTNNWDRTKIRKTLISYPLKPEYIRDILCQ